MYTCVCVYVYTASVLTRFSARSPQCPPDKCPGEVPTILWSSWEEEHSGLPPRHILGGAGGE